MIILSDVSGKNSWLRDNWIRAPDFDWNSVIVDPPFPMMQPAAVFETRNLMCVDFSLSSDQSNHGEPSIEQIGYWHNIREARNKIETA